MATTTKTVLITGATRGIGLAIATHYVNAGWKVIGTMRASSNAEKLKALSPYKIVTVDTGDETSVLAFARQLEGEPIDLLINNVGIIIEGSFESSTKQDIMRMFEVNTVGPLLVTRALKPNLELAAKSSVSAKVVIMSSRVGSISSNTSEATYFGNLYGYSASKAALNMLMRSMSIEMLRSNIVVVSMHPGYVTTELTNGQGWMKPEESATAIAEVASKLSLKDSGKFCSVDTKDSTPELPCRPFLILDKEARLADGVCKHGSEVPATLKRGSNWISIIGKAGVVVFVPSGENGAEAIDLPNVNVDAVIRALLPALPMQYMIQPADDHR
ncbi:unnamed protein product [Phytophthora lilii]|uniref:Unnamed protein product n=1 Tax=Phytophthora lilii TaxID=2077276 RepID=A0A9W6XHP7_9STRA|nr:unnamed protein product [Phytophthora lilii]